MHARPTSILRSHVTLGASVGIEYNPGGSDLPETTSDQGAAMAVIWAHLTFSWNDLDGGEWEFEKGDAQGFYLHKAEGASPIITDLLQVAKLTYPQISREQWLADAIAQAIEMLPTQQCPVAAAEASARAAARIDIPDQVSRHA